MCLLFAGTAAIVNYYLPIAVVESHDYLIYHIDIILPDPWPLLL